MRPCVVPWCATADGVRGREERRLYETSSIVQGDIPTMKTPEEAHVSNTDNKVSRLQRLLLRASTVVEEAEGRQITNRGMLLQLKKLKEVTYRGYYVLDTKTDISEVSQSDDLNNLANDGTMDNCTKISPSNGRFLIVVELAHETDELAWDKLYRSLCRRLSNSKAILISGMSQVSDLGTVPALRLTRLHEEEYWYFFRVLAFGSTNPYDHHPELASIAKEIATEIDGYFMITSVVTRVLRANKNSQFWRRAL
nr:unnamed protein product [Digitaria exilis]